MGDFNRQNRSGGRREFGNRGGSNRPTPMMHQAVCSNCGKQCEVPFRPTGSKPVYCRECFQQMGGGSPRPQFDRPQFENRNENRPQAPMQPNYQAQFEALNAKMDKILSLLTPAPVKAEPVESVLNEEIIDELVEEVTEEKPKKEKGAGKKKSTKKAKSSKSK